MIRNSNLGVRRQVCSVRCFRQANLPRPLGIRPTRRLSLLQSPGGNRPLRSLTLARRGCSLYYPTPIELQRARPKLPNRLSQDLSTPRSLGPLTCLKVAHHVCGRLLPWVGMNGCRSIHLSSSLERRETFAHGRPALKEKQAVPAIAPSCCSR